MGVTAAAVGAATVTASGLTYLTADAASGGDAGALYASISAVVVAMIGGTVAVVTNRRNQPATDPPNVRYVEEPTSHALPAAMSELTVELIEENKTLRIERDLWRRRAVQAGWDE